MHRPQVRDLRQERLQEQRVRVWGPLQQEREQQAPERRQEARHQRRPRCDRCGGHASSFLVFGLVEVTHAAGRTQRANCQVLAAAICARMCSITALAPQL